MHVQNIQDWMQYEVLIFKQYRASYLKVEPTHRNYKPAHKIYINHKHYVNKRMLKHLIENDLTDT